MNNNFSENIKKIRKEHNLSQEQLAEELGVSRQAISKWESGAAYPEMDKIITICKKYNVNIDDLLHKDIKEIKGEEEVKKNVNKYIEEFFKFITDTINLFVRMKFGSKIKCLFEQGCIALVLMIIISMIGGVLGAIISNSPLSLLSNSVYNHITGFLGAIYGLVTFVIAIIIMIRIFKARYLDYYQQEVVENNKEDKKESTEPVNKEGKIALKEESKIIVRNPKDSDYHFLRGLLKLFLLGIKFCTLWIEFFLCIGLLFIATGFVCSFLLSKTGVFFIGLLLGAISLGVMDVVVIVLLFNFIFNRKSNKKAMIWSFVSSVVVLGISLGLVFVGTLDFKLIPDQTEFHVENKEVEMEESFFINHPEVEYVQEERNNIKVEYETTDNTTVYLSKNSNGSYHIAAYTTNEFDTFKEMIKELNKKEIHNHTTTIKSIKIYANQTNIEKIKKNYNDHYDMEKLYQDREEELLNEINEKEEDIRELQDKIYELEEENERLKRED